MCVKVLALIIFMLKLPHTFETSFTKNVSFHYEKKFEEATFYYTRLCNGDQSGWLQRLSGHQTSDEENGFPKQLWTRDSSGIADQSLYEVYSKYKNLFP